MNRIPLIKSIMIPFPYSVELNTQVVSAREYMIGHEIHHLPVTEGNKIVGILDQVAIDNTNSKLVSEVELVKPHVFDLNERLDNILKIMADTHINTVLITRNEKLVGIFTVTDACRHFADYLREEFGPHDGNDAA